MNLLPGSIYETLATPTAAAAIQFRQRIAMTAAVAGHGATVPTGANHIHFGLTEPLLRTKLAPICLNPCLTAVPAIWSEATSAKKVTRLVVFA